MSYQAPIHFFPSRVLIFFMVAIAHWPIVSAGADIPIAAGEIANPSNQLGRQVEAMLPGENRSPRGIILINALRLGRSGVTEPVLVEDIVPGVNHKAAEAESSTRASSKRRKIIEFRLPLQLQRGTENNEYPRPQLKTDSEPSPMEVDDVMEPREEEDRHRPRAPEEEERAGVEELQRGLSEAFGGNVQLVSEIENSGIFKVTRRLLNWMTYRDLDSSTIEEEDEEILDNAFINDLPSDSDLVGRRIFWEDLDYDKRPGIDYAHKGPAEHLALKLQSHENMINRKLLGILATGGSGTLDNNGRHILEISKKYQAFLDTLERKLNEKPRSFIKQLATHGGNLN